MEAAVDGYLAVSVPPSAFESIRRGEPAAVLSPEIVAVVGPRTGIHRFVVMKEEAADACVPFVGRICQMRPGRPGAQIAVP